MTPATFALALLVGLAFIAVALNHCYARLALVELALNEGLPPGHERASPAHPRGQAAASPADMAAALASLDPGVHVFLSRNCHACQRLLEELDETPMSLASPVALRYVDRPRPIATDVAARQQAVLHELDQELALLVGADPLPFTVAIGAHGLLSQSVTPTVDFVLATARNAGISAERSAVQ